MEYRKAIKDDIELLVENRMEFVNSIAKIDNRKEFESNTLEYLKKHWNDNSLQFFICVDNKEIVSSCLLCVYDTIPVPSSLSGKTGVLLNVYTKKEYRGKGHAKRLIHMLIDEAKNLGVSKIQLDYTDDGYPLYLSLGFQKLDREMCLFL